MNGPNLMQFAMNMLKQNPNVARNPQAQAMLQVLQSGDAQKGPVSYTHLRAHET